MRKNDNYLTDMILRLKGSSIYREDEQVIIKAGTSSYEAETFSECLDLLREDFAHAWIWDRIVKQARENKKEKMKK